jgi:hypothetical protein
LGVGLFVGHLRSPVSMTNVVSASATDSKGVRQKNYPNRIHTTQANRLRGLQSCG